MSAGSAIFCYDANGNMTQKIDSGSTTSYTYDAENRMTAVSGAASATFVYDGDGNRVKGVVGGVTTTYIGNYFEWSGSTSTMKKYYYAGGTRVAERKGTTLYWLLSDHLGSTSITATSSGSKTAELRYKAWGETRYTYGTTQTTIRYTGQREESSLGLYWYASRWYSASLGRFVSPDTIIPQPGNPQAWDRYGYVYSNPVRYVDPSGNKACDGNGFDGCEGDIINNYSVAKKHWSPFPGAKNGSIPSRPDWFTPGNNPEWFPNNYQGTDYSPYWEKYVTAKNNDIYNKYRDKLFFAGDYEYISYSGKISDEVLISFIISGEFGNLNFGDKTSSDTYQAALSALSTQFHISCGEGCSLKEQLELVQGQQAWRASTLVSVAFGNVSLFDNRSPRWSVFLVDATKVTEAQYYAFGRTYNSYGNEEGIQTGPNHYPQCYGNFCVR